MYINIVTVSHMNQTYHSRFHTLFSHMSIHSVKVLEINFFVLSSL